jgi:hypothetical protein
MSVMKNIVDDLIPVFLGVRTPESLEVEKGVSEAYRQLYDACVDYVKIYNMSTRIKFNDDQIHLYTDAENYINIFSKMKYTGVFS